MPEPPMIPRTAFVMISPLGVEATLAEFCDGGDVVGLRHSGAVRRTEPRVRHCALGNLEIPGSRFARAGMTAVDNQTAVGCSWNTTIRRSVSTDWKFSGVISPCGI